MRGTSRALRLAGELGACVLITHSYPEDQGTKGPEAPKKTRRPEDQRTRRAAGTWLSLAIFFLMLIKFFLMLVKFLFDACQIFLMPMPAKEDYSLPLSISPCPVSFCFCFFLSSLFRLPYLVCC